MRILTATFLAFGTVAHSYAEGRQGVEVLIRTIHPELQRGRLVALSLRDGAVLRRGVDEVHVPLEDIIRITAADVSGARAASSGAFVMEYDTRISTCRLNSRAASRPQRPSRIVLRLPSPSVN